VPSFVKRLLHLELSAPWTGAPIDPSSADTHIRLLTVGELELAEILARCRAHKASLTGLLHALIARSLARRLGPGEKAFRSSTPIALAGYANPKFAGETFTPGETMYSVVTALNCDHDVSAIRELQRANTNTGSTNLRNNDDDDDDDAAIWAFAQDMTARLRAKAASLPRDDIAALSSLVGDWHAFFRGKFGQARDGSWEVSNLGSLGAADAGIISQHEEERVESGRAARWSIDRAVFTQGALATGAAFTVNVAGVSSRGVCATVSWQDGIVDVDVMEGLVGDLRAWIGELGETGRLGA
jgi:hypothetical protein